MTSVDVSSIRVGVAGWSVPPSLRRREDAGQSLLEQYAGLFRAVEINSSFYRPHKLATYQNWSASVPPDFRFAVKVPKLITHEQRLIGCDEAILAFMNGVRGLGDKLGALLVQLPPSAVFNASVAREFFQTLRGQTSAAIVCEARNPSWFAPGAAPLFAELLISRVSADPVPQGCDLRVADDGEVAANSGVVYVRLHGSPRMYYSVYSPEYLEDLRATLAAQSVSREVWCIFDNTAAGAAWDNARSLQGLISAPRML
jgi:uncharacterized protein YecE (DUF72 family)